MKKVYNYNPYTGQYVSTSEAEIDQLESQIQQQDIFILPANATFEPIPTDLQEDETPVLIDNEWFKIKNYTGMVLYNKQTQEQYIVPRFGIIPDMEKYTTQKPEPNSKWGQETGSWIQDLDKLKAKKNEEIKKAHLDYMNEPKETIYGYFPVSESMVGLLDRLYTYLIESGLEGRNIRDAYNQKTFRTIAEIKDLRLVLGRLQDESFDLKWDLQEQIESADLESIDQIEWKIN